MIPKKRKRGGQFFETAEGLANIREAVCGRHPNYAKVAPKALNVHAYSYRHIVVCKEFIED